LVVVVVVVVSVRRRIEVRRRLWTTGARELGRVSHD
jgi:hypothetical protein